VLPVLPQDFAISLGSLLIVYATRLFEESDVAHTCFESLFRNVAAVHEELHVMAMAAGSHR
jgi:hypothetical protein